MAKAIQAKLDIQGQGDGITMRDSTSRGTTAENGGVPTMDSAELYTVDPENEMVKSHLDKYTNMNDPLMKRIAQKGRDETAGRGMSNSSLGAQSAMGAVLDKAGEWATTDAAAYKDRKTESMRAVTSKYGTDVSADASKYASEMGLAGSKSAALASVRSSELAATAQVKSTKISSAAQVKAAGINAAASIASSRISANAQIRAQSIAATSNQKIAAAAEANKLIGHKVNLVSSVLDYTSQQNIAKIRSDDLSKGNKATAYSSNQGAFMTGVANIDQTASGPTQQEQYNRLETVYNSGQNAIKAWS
jgi:hypothetical protein|tara:strand:- start:562 stop:1476 length:915 start_codon:yes stop_codon:yes gene_type:complete